MGSGLFNFTAKSGGNQYHGSAYDYLQNTAFNAGQKAAANPGDHALTLPAFALGQPLNSAPDHGHLEFGGPGTSVLH